MAERERLEKAVRQVLGLVAYLRTSRREGQAAANGLNRQSHPDLRA